MKKNKKGGFTLIELLVVVAIIGILASVVLAALNNAGNKGADAAVKSDLSNAIKQGEIFFSTNTVAVNTYTNFCSTTSPIGGANTIYLLLMGAVKASGLASYSQDAVGSTTTATCNDGDGSAWAAEVPLKTSGRMWCVDSTGKSKQEVGSVLTTTTTTVCT